MSIMRIHKTANFTVMSNFHFKEKQMSLKAKGLLSLMLSLPDDWNYSVSGLCKLSKDGKDSVMSALSELEKFGYLSRSRITDNRGRFCGVEYDIYEAPQVKKPVSEKQISENRISGKQNSENPPLLNTNQSSIKEIKDIKELNTNETVVNAMISDASLRELYMDYIEMRESINAPMTPKGIEMLIKRCNRIAKNNIQKQRMLVEAAIINNWKNIYKPGDNIEEEITDELREFYGLR